MSLHVTTPADRLKTTLESICSKLSGWAEFHDDMIANGSVEPFRQLHVDARDDLQQLIVQIDRALHDYEKER